MLKTHAPETHNILAGPGAGKDTAVNLLERLYPNRFYTFSMSSALRDMAIFDREISLGLATHGCIGRLLPAPLALRTSRWWLKKNYENKTQDLLLNGPCRQWGEWPLMQDLRNQFGFARNVIVLAIHPDEVLIQRMTKRKRIGETAKVRRTRIDEWHETIKAAHRLRKQKLAILHEINFDGTETPEEFAHIVWKLFHPNQT